MMLISDYGIILEILGFIFLLMHQMFTFRMIDRRRAKFAFLVFIGIPAVAVGLVFQLSTFN